MALFSGSSPPRRAMAVIGVTAIAYSIAIATPRPSLGGSGLAVLALTVVAGLAWLAWAWSGESDDRLAAVALSGIGVPGGVLAVLTSGSGAVAFAFVAVFAAARSLTTGPAATVAALTWTGIAVASFAGGHPASALIGVSAGLAVTFLGGRNIRDFVLGREHAELLLAETQVAREEQARAAALAERARIAREIHDVLAHSLSGLAVQLEGARLVLAQQGDPSVALAQVESARALAREGLEEARRAVGALRGDSIPLHRLLDDLVAERRGGAELSWHIEGTEREIPPEAAMAAYRIAQEAVTNAQRHAPGATIDICVLYGEGQVQMTITNQRAASDHNGGPSRMAREGGGYGLIGMRERAALLGGTVVTGPSAEGWRVEFVVPA